jgi:hypothetical protein
MTTSIDRVAADFHAWVAAHRAHLAECAHCHVTEERRRMDRRAQRKERVAKLSAALAQNPNLVMPVFDLNGEGTDPKPLPTKEQKAEPMIHEEPFSATLARVRKENSKLSAGAAYDLAYQIRQMSRDGQTARPVTRAMALSSARLAMRQRARAEHANWSEEQCIKFADRATYGRSDSELVQMANMSLNRNSR